VTSRDEERLYLRGTDPEPYLHVTERGEAGYRGVAFAAVSAEDLHAAAQMEGASTVEKLDAPGGGECVRFTDPDGNGVELVHGRELLPPLPVRGASPLNRGSARKRLGVLQRVPTGAPMVKRLGHVVIRVADFRTSNTWYAERFGLIPSDQIHLGDEKNVVASFNRCDRGEEYTDHHTFLCVGIGEPGFDHAAFEVEDFDAVMAGHDHLAKRGYQHKMGVGRHVLGSQVYDYWLDPFGSMMEHFTDGDLLNAEHETGHWDPGTALGSQWGSMNL
jgi:catechol 2,3-dioxygenase-like lactoylglutathione lyase family enzyme